MASRVKTHLYLFFFYANIILGDTMKVALYYTRPFETGGVEKTMYERGKYLSEHGFDITFIYASNDSPLNMLADVQHKKRK